MESMLGFLEDLWLERRLLLGFLEDLWLERRLFEELQEVRLELLFEQSERVLLLPLLLDRGETLS